MSDTISIPGLTESTGPRNLNMIRGKLTLPADFPEGKYACKWTKKGPNVERDKQREQVIGTNITSDGWTVWLDSKTKKPCERTISDGTYILMVRPKQLQVAIQKILGNVSRDRMEREQRGETVAGAPKVDRGIFNHEELKRIPGLGAEGDEELTVSRNQIGSLDEERSVKAQTRRTARAT